MVFSVHCSGPAGAECERVEGSEQLIAAAAVVAAAADWHQTDVSEEDVEEDSDMEEVMEVR